MSEGRSTFFCSAILYRLYGWTEHQGIRTFLRRLVLRFEGGAMYSLTARLMLSRYHGVDVGLYTIGPCESGPENFAAGTSIGRYSSIYYTVRTLAQSGPDNPNGSNEPLPASLSDSSGMPGRVDLDIGNDAFVGHNAIILPSVNTIGDGAFVGAGSVVVKDVPPYGVVMGNPGRVVRYRFTDETIEALLQEEWWLKSLAELQSDMAGFQRPLDQEADHEVGMPGAT